jgi:tellurite resistance protein
MADDLEQFSESQQSLEDQFFLKEDRQLIEKLKQLKRMEESIEALSRVSGITNKDVLQRLVELKVHPESVAALALVPIVEVAWADGKLDENEKKAILKGAEKTGYAKKSMEHDLLKGWLMRKPAPQLMVAWEQYLHGLSEQLSADALAELKKELLSHARAVAEASGGFLGIGAISPEEQKMLERIENAFRQ